MCNSFTVVVQVQEACITIVMIILHILMNFSRGEKNFFAWFLTHVYVAKSNYQIITWTMWWQKFNMTYTNDKCACTSTRMLGTIDWHFVNNISLRLKVNLTSESHAVARKEFPALIVIHTHDLLQYCLRIFVAQIPWSRLVALLYCSYYS